MCRSQMRTLPYYASCVHNCDRWGQSKITPNPAIGQANENFTLTPAILQVLQATERYVIPDKDCLL